MGSFLSSPSLQWLLYAHQGYRLFSEESEALERAGWTRSLPRRLFPLLRRTRVLSWEIMQLEERRRLRIPSTHPLARVVERAPGVRDRRERELADLSREIDERVAERNGLLESLSPLAVLERDRLGAYRPVSDTHSLRLTDEGRAALCVLRFAETGGSEIGPDAGSEALEARIARLAEAYRAVTETAWWRERLRGSLVQSAVADALWLAAVLSRHGAEFSESLARAEAAYRGFLEHRFWRQDPLPLCLALLASPAPRSVDAVVETNNALVALGVGVGVPIVGAAAVLVAGSPAPDLSFRIIEFHRLWKTMFGYGLAFSDGLMPSAARLALARRPVEATALLFREFDNRTTRFDPLNERAVRVAAALLSDLTLDYRDRGDGSDLFSREEAYVKSLMRRYRAVRTALVSRGGSERLHQARATVLAGALALCPGDAHRVVDLFDRARRLLAGAGLPPESGESAIVAMILDSGYREEWGVDHTRFAWDLYFATV